MGFEKAANHLNSVGLTGRYAKIGVDLEAVYKAAKKSPEFFELWPADSDSPTARLFGGSLEEIEKTVGYDPDDAAPWAWNLRAGLFEKDIGWSDLLDLLLKRGPADDR